MKLEPKKSKRPDYAIRNMAGAALLLMALGCSADVPENVEQPIAFSHIAHSENDISCTRCHQGAETQDEAGLPPISSCASCHRRGAIPDHPEVLKFMEKLEERQPLIWRKVNVLPSSAMVHFRHKPHARAGVDCSTCHGDVSQMGLAQKEIDTANMGWCVSCHRENEASVDCLTCHY